MLYLSGAIGVVVGSSTGHLEGFVTVFRIKVSVRHYDSKVVNRSAIAGTLAAAEPPAYSRVARPSCCCR